MDINLNQWKQIFGVNKLIKKSKIKRNLFFQLKI
jgi:hypothetical protein